MEPPARYLRVLFLGLWMVVGLIPRCLADVVVISTETNKTVTAIADLPALFGPPLPLSGFKGYVNYVSPPDACTVVKPPPQEYAGLWIALVRRFNCSFVDKVINAQHAGYAAVIVHNVGSNSLQPMSADHRAEEVVVPSVFIGQDDAIMIIENYLYNRGYTLEITDDLPFNLQNYLVPFAITIGICFIVMLTFMIVKCVRDYRRSRRHRLSSRALKKLPVHKFKKGDPYECCAVCLEDYVDNDKLRILPCSHAYHTKCIDPWLTKNRRVCPVCKRKVFTGDERPSDLESDSEDESSPLINSDEGTQGGTFNQQRENPFQEAERLAEERRQQRRRRRASSRNIECGPEGYQRLAESTDEDDEEYQEDEVEGARAESEQNIVDRKRVGSKRGEESESGEDDRMESPHEPPNVSIIVHGAGQPSGHTDTTSLASNHSASSQGSPPGPVQIAVDVVNCNPAATSLPKQPPHVPEDAGSERDYVV
ncbi:E3 ubiquitin-protein ligase RNF13-like [Penaeus monodon]|uniref:E3 ubiquitin-protein ligase RNF13-like n=1 Tax=Penaeus monodon TaxID=6687 RepID=UPI0018A7085E|nr:E3 ubiquitin-protein ligase RNF13-like [Penaeus monodon]XP_037803496.1 E3 ubiquitin-protein ligase RNF13-like [Penaeus monodon]